MFLLESSIEKDCAHGRLYVLGLLKLMHSCWMQSFSTSLLVNSKSLRILVEQWESCLWQGPVTLDA